MLSQLLAFSLLLATASHGNASPAQMSPLDLFMQLAASTCSRGGQVICSQDCDQVILCVSDGQGGFESVTIETCTTNTRCSAEQQTCVDGSSTCGAPITEHGIECTTRAVFPDPYNCSVYHICLAASTESIPGSCDAGHAFNSVTKDCSGHMTDPVCTDGPVPACVRPGQSGALESDPSIYYICTSQGNVLKPTLHKCHDGQIYDPTAVGCVDPSGGGSSSNSPGTTPPTSPTPDPGSTEPPTAGEACSPPNQIVPDPDNCRRFYECSPYGFWLHASCTVGFYFNPVHKRCELGGCSD